MSNGRRFDMGEFSQQINQLFNIVHQGSNLPTNTSDLSRESKKEDLVCPGLVHEISSQKWFVPPGYSSDERTYCETCVKNYGLECKLSKSATLYSRCNCESYLEVNKMDNKIFNISIWSDDYRTFKIADDENNVPMPTGKFHILITYDQKKYKKHKRIFQATIYLHNKKIWVSPKTTHSIIARDIGYFINKGSPLTDLFSSYYMKDGLNLFTDGQLKVCIDVFNVTKNEYKNATDHDFGKLILRKNKYYQESKIGVKYEHPEQKYMHCFPDFATELYTKNPIEMTFNLKSIPCSEDKDINTITKTLANTIIKDIKRELNLNTKELAAKNQIEQTLSLKLKSLQLSLKCDTKPKSQIDFV